MSEGEQFPSHKFPYHKFPYHKFPYHKGLAPMMWVIFALSLIELAVVHFFVALNWPIIGWTLTTISAIGVIWLVWWILSFERLPDELCGNRLTLWLGVMKTVDLELSNVARITSTFEPGALENKGIINLAAIAHPNRCIELSQPIEKDKSRVYIRLDDPAVFDEAMREHGFEIH